MLEEDIFITRDEFIAGQQWKWESLDSDVWFYDPNDNRIKQLEGGVETGFYADIDELGDDTFTYTYSTLTPPETNSSLYSDLAQYNG
jgi:hypothetical protein